MEEEALLQALAGDASTPLQQEALRIIQHIAATGKYVQPWPQVRPLLMRRMAEVVTAFATEEAGLEPVGLYTASALTPRLEPGAAAHGERDAAAGAPGGSGSRDGARHGKRAHDARSNESVEGASGDAGELTPGGVGAAFCSARGTTHGVDTAGDGEAVASQAHEEGAAEGGLLRAGSVALSMTSTTTATEEVPPPNHPAVSSNDDVSMADAGGLGDTAGVGLVPSGSVGEEGSSPQPPGDEGSRHSGAAGRQSASTVLPTPAEVPHLAVDTSRAGGAEGGGGANREEDAHPPPHLSLSLHSDASTGSAPLATDRTLSAPSSLEWSLPAALSADLEDLQFSLTQFLHDAPWTVQRLCEILATPRRYYSTARKLLFALKKCLDIFSTQPPCLPAERTLPSPSHPAYVQVGRVPKPHHDRTMVVAGGSPPGGVHTVGKGGEEGAVSPRPAGRVGFPTPEDREGGGLLSGLGKFGGGANPLDVFSQVSGREEERRGLSGDLSGLVDPSGWVDLGSDSSDSDEEEEEGGEKEKAGGTATSSIHESLMLSRLRSIAGTVAASTGRAAAMASALLASAARGGASMGGGGGVAAAGNLVTAQLPSARNARGVWLTTPDGRLRSRSIDDMEEEEDIFPAPGGGSASASATGSLLSPRKGAETRGGLGASALAEDGDPMAEEEGDDLLLQLPSRPANRDEDDDLLTLGGGGALGKRPYSALSSSSSSSSTTSTPRPFSMGIGMAGAMGISLQGHASVAASPFSASLARGISVSLGSKSQSSGSAPPPAPPPLAGGEEGGESGSGSWSEVEDDGDDAAALRSQTAATVVSPAGMAGEGSRDAALRPLLLPLFPSGGGSLLSALSTPSGAPTPRGGSEAGGGDPGVASTMQAELAAQRRQAVPHAVPALPSPPKAAAGILLTSPVPPGEGGPHGVPAGGRSHATPPSPASSMDDMFSERLPLPGGGRRGGGGPPLPNAVVAGAAVSSSLVVRPPWMGSSPSLTRLVPYGDDDSDSSSSGLSEASSDGEGELPPSAWRGGAGGGGGGEGGGDGGPSPAKRPRTEPGV